MSTVIWTGPVSAASLAETCSRASALLVTYNQGLAQPSGSTISSNAFRALAVELGERPLDTLLLRAGRPRESRVVLAAFSAGGAFLERVLERQAGDERICGVIAADSYYTSSSSPLVKPGYAAFARRARSGSGPWMLLSSSDNAGPGYLSCSASLAAFGRAFDLSAEGVALAGQPPGSRSTQVHGGIVWADYGAALKHAEHATRFAPFAVAHVLAGGAPIPPTGRVAGGGSGALAFGLAALALLAGRRGRS